MFANVKVEREEAESNGDFPYKEQIQHNGDGGVGPQIIRLPAKVHLGGDTGLCEGDKEKMINFYL